jgi:hypothetical protein
MDPHAVFFLGDGGWDSSALIAAAGGAKANQTRAFCHCPSPISFI